MYKFPLVRVTRCLLPKRSVKEAGILTGAVGLITKAAQAEEIIRTGKADLILIARESLRNPYFPLTAAKELGVEIEWPVQYLRAKQLNA